MNFQITKKTNENPRLNLLNNIVMKNYQLDI